ncbi:replication protein O [Paraburkholderia sp. BR10872]|uniref:replication protein O n=1 Tax=Paraburkholderia sp. BR10872 TaxID=3236989 RepID=UPI0034D359FD
MLIAHSNAGEGNVRPHTPESCPAAGFEPSTRNLPYQTLRAQQCAMELKSLPQRARCALAAIALTVDCRKPLASVFARRAYLTERAGISERTWFRAERDLVEAGLITVAEQIRKGPRARFDSAYIYLTPEAVRLLRFADELVARGRRPARASAEQEQSAAAEAPSSSASPTANPAAPFTEDLLPASSQKRQPAGELPEDLERLRSLGFHKFLIFRLMGEAREQGKLLSDVVEAIWHSLKAAKRPIRYLQAMLARPIDFRHVAAQRRATEAGAQRELHEQKQDLDLVGQCAGREFVSADGRIRYHVSSDAATLTSHHLGEDRPRVAAGSWRRWFAEGLSSGAVLAKPEAEEEGGLQVVTKEARDACFATLRASLRMRGAVGPARAIA